VPDMIRRNARRGKPFWCDPANARPKAGEKRGLAGGAWRHAADAQVAGDSLDGCLGQTRTGVEKGANLPGAEKRGFRLPRPMPAPSRKRTISFGMGDYSRFRRLK